MKVYFLKRYCKSSFQDVLVILEPSLSPLAGSFKKKMMRKREISDMMGVTLRPQFHEPPAKAATPDPAMKPKPLSINRFY